MMTLRSARSRVAATAFALLCATAIPRAAGAAESYKISDPVIHENLAIYLIHGKSASGPVPLTLAEALEKGSVQVRETGEVNELEIENTSDEPVYVQSGDIVKGGRQDRTFTTSLLLPAHSGSVPIAAFCVEHGRWSEREGEASATFASSDSAMPSREAKLAMKAPIAKTAGNNEDQSSMVQSNTGSGNDTGNRQQEVWAKVASTQSKLSSTLGAPVNSEKSESSLQLALENEKLAKAQTDYVAALEKSGTGESDVIGYAFAINGKLNSADVYPSNGLFLKMWPKLLRASATEAIGEKTGEATTPPTADAVLAFLSEAEQGASKKTAVNDVTELDTRDSDKAVYFETAPAKSADDWVHRNYLVK